MADTLEPPVSGASGGILGVAALQRAADTITNSFTKFGGALDKFAQAEAAFRGGQAVGQSGSVRAYSMTMTGGRPNGGGATMNGQPLGGGSGIPDEHDARHRGGSDSPDAPATPATPATKPGLSGGVTRTMAAAGAVSGIYQNQTQSLAKAYDDSTRYNMVSSYYAFNPSQAKSLGGRIFNGGINFAHTGEDRAATGAQIMSTAGGVQGSRAYNSMYNAAQQIGMGNPAMSGAQASQVASSFYGPQGYLGLRTVGVKTIGKGGARQSPTQIANQILNKVDPSGSIRTIEDATTLVTDQMSPLNLGLSNWVANGLIDGDQKQAVLDAVFNILKARMAGMGVSKLNTLLNQTRSDNPNKKQQAAAKGALAQANIDTSAIQDQKDLEADKSQAAVNRLSTFADSVHNATTRVDKFTRWLTKVTSDPKDPVGRYLGPAISTVSDSYHSAGLLGVATAVVPGLASVASGSGLGNGLLSLLTGGRGGDNESRMSVLSSRGGSASVSGTPHSAFASRYGANLGPFATGAGGGGGGKSSGAGSGGKKGSGSSGQKMILPVHGFKLGVGFGVAGSHWSSGHHTGQDIECPTGTPVHAPANGTVIFAGTDGPYGRLVKIDHGGGVVSYMAHNSRLVAHVGARVRQGQLIAYSGATGNVTGPHCHFEVRVNGRAVNPMSFVTGGSRVAGSGGGGGTSGSGTSDSNGSGTDSTSGGGSMAGSSIGMSEVDVLAGVAGSELSSMTGSSAAGGSGLVSGSSSSSSSGSGSGGGGSKPGATTAGLAGNRKVVNKVAAKYGWGKGAEWNALVNLVMSESGFRNTAQNPTSTAYGMFQFLDSTWAGYGPKTSDSTKQAQYGLKYVKNRYGDPIHAWNFHKSHNWYDKGAWEIKQDEVAQVHKREMIIPAKEADQIREILINGNPYKAQGNQAKTGSAITFAANSINISVTSTGNATADGQAIGKAFIDTLQQNARIGSLQKGALT